MQFLFQPLTWGFLLVAGPILIHLINMLRHRKQKWAAMDFLLESYRRNRRWVMLKQWLLLAARMLAMLLLVAMLAKWVSSSRWLGMLGGQATHHYLLLDDSYSMGATGADDSAYASALRAVSALVRSISAQPGQHQLTLLRLSRATLATRAAGGEARIDAAADLLAQSVPQDPAKLLDRLSATEPTALQLSPEDALELITPLIVDNAVEQAQVYVLSDFRRNEFGEPEVLRNKLRALVDDSAELHLIDCSEESAANLSLVSVEPEQEVWAAGVPLLVRFQVRNYSTQMARNVVAKIRSISYAAGATEPRSDSPYSGEILDLPPVVIEQIAAGETVTRQVQVIFGTAGQHAVEVTLPEDSLATDNRRWSVIGIRSSQRVLLVDGEVDRSNAFFFQTVLAPDARLRTGMTSETVDAAAVRDMPIETLASFDTVALLDVPRLDRQAVNKIEDFCRSGGGVLVVCGRNTNLQFVNQELFREGEGFFPVQLQQIVANPTSVDDQSPPQVAATEHPILGPLRQLSVSPFSLLQIRQQLLPTAGSLNRTGLELIATGPLGSPLLIDQGLGDGRVVTLLTGLTNDWSNWAQDPTFVVVALRTLGYLGSFRRASTSEPVGSPLEMVVSDTTVLPEVEVLLPAKREGSQRVMLLRQVAVEAGTNSVSRLDLSIDLADMDRDLVDSLLRPGIYETWMTNSQGEKLLQNSAHNVAAAEGNLDRVTHAELEQKLAGIPLDIRTADAISGGGLSSPEASHSTLLMACLAGLLLIEQLLAYSASYHAPRPTGAHA
ncbi:MAG: BatA domain-containing protein, partial [Aureliella sp.]